MPEERELSYVAGSRHVERAADAIRGRNDNQHVVLAGGRQANAMPQSLYVVRVPSKSEANVRSNGELLQRRWCGRRKTEEESEIKRTRPPAATRAAFEVVSPGRNAYARKQRATQNQRRREKV